MCALCLLGSHPSWVCGLKHRKLYSPYIDFLSHPSWVCGLKLFSSVREVCCIESHPSWVCGLKQEKHENRKNLAESHPSWVCGLKLWPSQRLYKEFDVTPFVGVWIETDSELSIAAAKKVTPFVGVWIETSELCIGVQTVRSHPSWVCGLKRKAAKRLLSCTSHTLRGCVD